MLTTMPTNLNLETTMTCETHKDHQHQHGANCGHTAIKHGDHIDYLHDGHLHHVHNDHVDEHRLEISVQNPDHCTPAKACGCVAGCDCNCADGCDCHSEHGCHDKSHVHGPNCGHEAVPHGDHIDYLVNGRLHHPHGDHCDDHGAVELVA